MYDIIIIGAGSAGCVLANRLSANPNLSVLLLEAGKPDNRFEIQIPAAFNRLFRTDYDWNYETEPQQCLNGRRLYVPRGKTLGGSSSMNAMIYIRGNPADYDAWATFGNLGWSYEDVLPYFKRMEDQARGADEFHGTGGPLHVEDLRDPRPPSLAFVQAAQQAGLPANSDFNGPEQEGVGLYQVTMRRGARLSAAAAYLKPVLDRPNLTVQTGAFVHRLLSQDGRFTTVEFQQGDITQIARARREIILAGGAINTPQILMLSGIGPGEHLQAMGIDVKVDLPGVGQNLQDHIASGVLLENRQGISLLDAEHAGNLVKYLLTRVGPLTSNVAEAGAFLRSSSALDKPDLQLHFASHYYLNHGFDNPPGHGVSLGPLVLKPRSRGTVTLHDVNPMHPPIIDPHYLSDPDGEDMRLLVEGIKIVRRILAQPAFAAFRGPEVLPGDAVTDENGLREHIRTTAETFYHPVGTCKMAPDTDPTAVVDPELRLRKVDGVRVVDASIMPEIPSGNTNAPTMMVAEKAADMILMELK